MKISHQELQNIILNEVKNLPEDIREGVLDYLKGAGGAAADKAGATGKSIANAVKDKATAAKNKVGQVAGDIKSAGQQASLKADVQKASQEAGMAIEGLIGKFTDLLARAQSMRMEAEEKEIKAELQALRNYQETAAAETGDEEVAGDDEYADLGKDLMATSGGVPTDSEPGNVTAMPKPEIPPKTNPAPVKMGSPKPSPEPVKMGSQPSSTDFGSNEPFDWRSDKAKGANPAPTAHKPAATITGKASTKPKPTLRTKLDKASIRKAVDAAGGDINKAAKALKLTKQQMIQALGNHE